MTPQFHRFAVEELLEGAYFAPTYGNTLMGLAVPQAAREARRPAGTSSTTRPAPRAMIEVVDPDHPDRVVGYGETGRVRLTTLTKEFFMPRFLERDEAEREPPCDALPLGRRAQRAAVLALPDHGRGGRVLMLHLPILRQGRPYRSVDVAPVPHFRDAASRSSSSARPTPGLVRRDLREDAQAAMRAAARGLHRSRELVALCRRAADSS